MIHWAIDMFMLILQFSSNPLHSEPIKGAVSVPSDGQLTSDFSLKGKHLLMGFWNTFVDTSVDPKQNCIAAPVFDSSTTRAHLTLPYKCLLVSLSLSFGPFLAGTISNLTFWPQLLA